MSIDQQCCTGALVPTEDTKDFDGVRVSTTTVRALDVADPLVPERDAVRLFPSGAISVRTMQRLRRAKKIGYVTIGRRIYYRYSDLQRYIDARRVQPRR
jgi:hypothetical protein